MIWFLAATKYVLRVRLPAQPEALWYGRAAMLTCSPVSEKGMAQSAPIPARNGIFACSSKSSGIPGLPWRRRFVRLLPGPAIFLLAPVWPAGGNLTETDSLRSRFSTRQCASAISRVREPSATHPRRNDNSRTCLVNSRTQESCPDPWLSRHFFAMRGWSKRPPLRRC